MMAKQDLRTLIDAERQCDPNGSLSYHSRVSPAHRYVCMTIPKIACSTIKVALDQFEGLPVPEHLGLVHDQGLRLTNFSTEEIVEMLTSPDWFRFCFVRNPYYRLFSAYKSKVGNTWEQQYVWLQDEIRQRFDYPVRDGRPAGIVAFRDFVRFIRDAEEPVRRDGHWNLQTNVLMPQAIEYDFVGRFESFTRDFERVLRQLDVPAEIVATASEVRNPTTQIHHAAAYDGELADCVYEMYEADFERFGYDRDSWMFDFE